MKRPGRIIGCFLLGVFLFLPLSSYAQSEKKPIRIGVASMITPVDAVKYYQEIVDYISEKLGEPVEMVLRRTYDEMDRMLEKGKVDAAFICSAPYVKNRREFGVELLAAPQVNGTPFYHSYIIVHKDSHYRTLQDLEGKTFAFTDPKSNSGKLYPEYLLAKMGTTPDDFFSRYVYSYSHNKSVEMVAKKVVDGAAVESLVYHYMEKKGSPYVRETRIIDRSPRFGIPPIVVSTATPLFLKEKLKEILLGMHGTSKGRAILDAMLIDRFVEVPDSNYDSIRKMEAFLENIKAPEKPEEKKAGIIHFAVIPRDNPRIAYEKYQPLIDYLVEDTGMKIELVLKKSYEDTVTGLANGSIDIALLGPLTYLEARIKAGAVAILKSITEKDESFFRSVIIARKDSPVNSLSDMKGRSFAFASVKSTSGNLIPRYLLAEAGIHLRDLLKYKNFDYHDSVVKWVLKGEYDAGAVREAVAEKYLPLGLKIIEKSKAIPTGPVVVGPKTPYQIAERIKNSLLKMDRDPRGREKLAKTDPELRGGFIEASDSDYTGIRKMINDVPTTCGIGCHPKIKL
jgi:phosphonate transport system substrate-binding protein